MLQYFFCLKLFFYILRCIFQLLANAFVPTNIKATVKLQIYVAKEDIYYLSSIKDNAWILQPVRWETKYHSSHIY